MKKGTQAVSLGSDNLESAVAKLRGLSLESQTVIASIIDRMALAEGVSGRIDHKPSTENVGLWLTKMRSERKSEGAIRLYEYLARRFLRQTPSPARTDVREYLARRIGETSPSSAETERKALASLFSFLHSEGLWRENPLEGVQAHRPALGREGEELPSSHWTTDCCGIASLKMLKASCHHPQSSHTSS